MLLSYQENRKKNSQGDNGEDHSCDGADSECEPKDLLGAVEEEGNEAENGREDGQGDGDDLVVKGSDISADGSFVALRMTCLQVLENEVYAGVYGDATEHDEGGKTALVKGEVADAEG